MKTLTDGIPNLIEIGALNGVPIFIFRINPKKTICGMYESEEVIAQIIVRSASDLAAIEEIVSVMNEADRKRGKNVQQKKSEKSSSG